MIARDRYADVAVLCIGDVMLDRFVTGSVDRISPESPVPVLTVRDTRLFPGGAANVARNIAALGARCTLVGVLGPDRVGAELAGAIAEIDGVTPVLMVAQGRPTTEKVRFVANGQQLLRADQEDGAPLSKPLEDRLLEHIAAHLDGHQVMVLSDYAKGVLTPAVVHGAIALARTRHMPVIVDPKSADMTRYGGATVVTPNAKEVLAATGIDPTSDDALAERAGRAILDGTGIESVLVTRAHRGMTLVSRTAEPVHLPARAREVFDVVGAGDTVVATLAASIAVGETLADAALLANVAAGIVVGKRGTATVSLREIAVELRRAIADPLAPLHGKIMGLPDAVEQADAWRDDGHAVGVVTGRFDAIGANAVSDLGRVREHCGRLIVGLVVGDDDDDERAGDRAAVLAAMTAVDAVVRLAPATSAESVRRLGSPLLLGDAARVPG